MIGRSSATPLIALDAVVIDTETTGLDPRKAWTVEIAAVRITGGRLQTATVFRRLIRPGVVIPPLSTQIHGIDEAAVADAPSFAEVWPDLSAFIGDSVVIGHALGFDLAVLKRECERADVDWKRPRTLDTRLLAEVAEPNLAGFSLDNLAAWLGVEITDRHTARGDAVACAAHLPRAAAATARGRHPHAGGGGAGLPRADRSAGGAPSRRLDRAGRSPEPGRRRTDAAAYRQLRLPAPRSRHHARAAGVHCSRGNGSHRARAADEGTHLLAVSSARRNPPTPRAAPAIPASSPSAISCAPWPSRARRHSNLPSRGS